MTCLRKSSYVLTPAPPPREGSVCDELGGAVENFEYLGENPVPPATWCLDSLVLAGFNLRERGHMYVHTYQ